MKMIVMMVMMMITMMMVMMITMMMETIILSVRYYLLNIWFDKLSFSNNFFGNFLFVYLFIWFDKMFLREHMSPH